jgi:hypothetical protein
MILGQIPLPLRPKIWSAMPVFLQVSSDRDPEECDATAADQGTAAGKQKIQYN